MLDRDQSTSRTIGGPDPFAAIERELAAERAARGALALELAELRRRLDGIESALEHGTAVAPPAPTGSPNEESTVVPREATMPAQDIPVPTAQQPAEPRPPFDAAELEEAGLAPDRVDALRRRWEQYELEKLEVNDLAMREGYFMTPRHRAEHWALAAAFRADVGDEGYDAYLYATGKPNRIVVRSVLAGSAAEEAGLLPDDVVIRYDRARIFSNGELQLATAAGASREMVSLEVLREGRLVELRMPRGPLGSILEPVQAPPVPVPW